LLTLSLALIVAACSGSNSSSTSTVTTPAATVNTETFTGTVPPNFGVDFKPFTVAQAGTISVTLTAAGPPPTIQMGLGVGTPSASACSVTSSGYTQTSAGTTAQLSFSSVAAGSYCVQVFDLGNALSPVTYSVTVAHT